MDEQILMEAMRVLEKHNGFARTRDFLEAGISPYYVKKLESIGEIERVKQGVYRLASAGNEPLNEMLEVSRLVPKGVICLLSALSYYELTTYHPWEYQIAIHRGEKNRGFQTIRPLKLCSLRKLSLK